MRGTLAPHPRLTREVKVCRGWGCCAGARSRTTDGSPVSHLRVWSLPEESWALTAPVQFSRDRGGGTFLDPWVSSKGRGAKRELVFCWGSGVPRPRLVTDWGFLSSARVQGKRHSTNLFGDVEEREAGRPGGARTSSPLLCVRTRLVSIPRSLGPTPTTPPTLIPTLPINISFLISSIVDVLNDSEKYSACKTTAVAHSLSVLEPRPTLCKVENSSVVTLNFLPATVDSRLKKTIYAWLCQEPTFLPQHPSSPESPENFYPEVPTRPRPTFSFFLP